MLFFHFPIEGSEFSVHFIVVNKSLVWGQGLIFLVIVQMMMMMTMMMMTDDVPIMYGTS